MSSLVGIDIGNNSVKLAVREGSSMRLVSARTPENMVDAGRITSPESMAQFLAALRKQEHVREKRCAMVLSGNQSFFRRVTLPAMSVDEVMLNLPYEFRDFISGSTDDYVFDYAVDRIERDVQGNVMGMSLFAGACPREFVTEMGQMFKKAGFKLELAMPAPMAYARLVRAHVATSPAAAQEDVVLVDVGNDNVIVSLFRAGNYDSSRTIDFGTNALDQVIADLKGVDPYTASSYKQANYEDVLEDPACEAVYDRFALEVNKVVNFYNFNNPEGEIDRIYFMGGGAKIAPLANAIIEVVGLPAAAIDVILPTEARQQANASSCALAVAALLEGEAM